jgi:hypothetical protein
LGIKFWLPYIFLSTLVGISIELGLILLIVPGIILSVRFLFAEFDLLFNQGKPIDSMRNSWSATKSHAGILFGGYLILAVAIYGPVFLLSLWMTFQLGKSSISFHVIDTALNLVCNVLGAIFTIFSFHIYSLSRAQQKA